MTSRGRGRRHLIAAALALAIALSAALPAAAQASWGAPFDLMAPGSQDVLGPGLEFSPTGAVAASFGTEDVDTPGSSQGYVVQRSAAGAVGSEVAVPGAGEVLALTYAHRELTLLTGSNPPGATCCASAQAVQVTPAGQPGRPHTVVGGLTGETIGQLETLADGRMVAAVATERGVWVAQSTSAGGFGGAHVLTAPGRMVQAMAAAWLGGERSIIGWTAAPGPAGAADPHSITVAAGSAKSAPAKPHVAITVPATHRIDELALAHSTGSGATAAWIESWSDRAGYHSRTMASDLGPGATERALSPAGRLASGLRFAGDGAGDQALAWESCTVDDACTVEVAARRHGGRFGAPRSLGAIDPAQAPALAVGPSGQVVVGWVSGGRPMAAVATSAGGGFGAATALSTSTYAMNIAVACGPGRHALAAWSQGTLNPSVVAAAY